MYLQNRTPNTQNKVELGQQQHLKQNEAQDLGIRSLTNIRTSGKPTSGSTWGESLTSNQKKKNRNSQLQLALTVTKTPWVTPPPPPKGRVLTCYSASGSTDGLREGSRLSVMLGNPITYTSHISHWHSKHINEILRLPMQF